MKSDYEARMREDIDAVNAALEQWIPQGKAPYTALHSAMRYSIGAGGKRIRPVLVLEFARAFGGDAAKALPFACAVEMVHTYSLIHDDLPCMDDDDYRRGKPSCHKQFGEATALLAGDGLLTLAFEIIASAPENAGASPAASLRAALELSRLAGISGMVGGQEMDLANEGRTVEISTLKETDYLKTSALLMAACRMGAASAGADEENIERAGQYAGALGIAFQIVDDILDVTGDAALLGKPVGSDSAQNKVTYVSLFGLDGAREEARRYTQEALRILAEIPDSGFLCALTEELLGREK